MGTLELPNRRIHGGIRDSRLYREPSPGTLAA
jgi:hypothetical protein